MSYPYDNGGPLGALTGIARISAGAWIRTASWGIGTSVRAARAAAELLEPSSGPEPDARYEVANGDRRPEAAGAPLTLRERGAELLRRSAEVDGDDDAHPAYARILEELHPDEARILRLLALEGPQPSVDVRSVQLMGLGSQVVAEGLNMIGPRAGARYPLRVHAYLDNLNRLGLIWFSKEALADPRGYQVLEAQPAVLEGVKRAPRAKTVHRSIRLTPFGTDFVETCLPLEESYPVPSDSDELGS
jgi:hypothetical protein